MGIGRVLQELRESAAATLPGRIDVVAAREGVALTSAFTVYDWWKAEADLVKVQFPALSILWGGTGTQLRRPAGRQGEHDVVISYGYRAASFEEIQRHMLYVPDAILLWLDDFPVASKAPGQGKQILQIAGGESDAIEIVHVPVRREKDTTGPLAGAFTWSVDVAVRITALDAALPPRLPRGAAVP